MMLVIGGSSYIGKHLYEHFSKKEKVIGTYFSKPQENLVYFDIRNPDLSKFDLSNIKYAIICSAIGRIDDCKKFEKEAYKINVEGTKKLIEQLFNREIIPVFFSSTYVFSGDKGDYKEEDARNPKTDYGRHKKEIEDFLINSKKKFLIFRLGKVYGLEKKDRTLLIDMIENLKPKYASDQIMSLLYVGDIVKIIDLAIKNDLTGIYHLADGKISWYDLALLLNKEFNLDKKIISCSIKDFDFLEKERPLKNTINNEKMVSELKFKFTSLEESISILKKAYSLI